ncbi:ATP-binding protein [Paraburkholderia sp. MM5482-R1]|uniref:ATP-binding protein n=1 Tax=unclassified Paraburkholderia TaxID=2615204 RepID=UPI003D1FE040
MNMRSTSGAGWAIQTTACAGSVVPGETGAGTAAAILARVRTWARLRVVWAERLWSEGQTSFDQGLAITSGEVRRILTEPDVQAERFEQFLREDDIAPLLRAAEAARAALLSNPFWNWIAQLFGLNPIERDLLCLLIAVEIDPRLGRVLAYLADDTQALHPSLEAAASLFALREQLPICVAMPVAALQRWRLARPCHGAQASQVRAAWQVDAAVVASVIAEEWVEPELGQAGQMIGLEHAQRQSCLYPEVLAGMLCLPFVRRLATAPDASDHASAGDEIALVGPDGAGRQTLAAQFAAALGRPLLAVDVSMLPGLADEPAADAARALDALVRAARLSHATGAVLYARDADAAPAAAWIEARRLAGLGVRGAKVAPAGTACTFVLPPLATARRVEVWTQYSDAPPAAVVRMQRLTPAEIRHEAQAAAASLQRSAPARRAPVQHELVHLLPCPYEWDDLVVAPELRRELEDFGTQVRLRWEVFEEWGFQRIAPLGQGVSALFGGPSGTGKTMAAQVLARSLGLHLYRVDLAGVVNKYIGETEKRLRDVFDACEQPGALLFFDEADALFGSRMQAKDAHDRFANIEIDYLLQRIEAFNGIAILATNRKNDLDTAFLRRLRFVMDFLLPGKPERRVLWRKALLARSPGGDVILDVDDVDVERLAEHMEVNGAQIKAIALGAAFLARNEGKRIDISHIELAARRELAKQGLRPRSPFRDATLP